MAVRITCRNVTLPDKTRAMVEKKIETIRRFFGKVDTIDVIFSGEKHRRQCEINVHAGHVYTACRVEGDDELNSFDKALKIARRQMKNSKGKIMERKKPAAGTAKRSGKAPVDEAED